ncbi:MAG: single-stranded-DNA-specific exonuclease RecJ [Victivallaceae bacterium]|nr:single-stranded-DNA-specific exonuclease RecJ [Victivallaceae bacterium]
MAYKKWINACDNQKDLIERLTRKFSRPVAMFLAARGVEEELVEQFLNPKLGDLSDPYRFPGIQDAVARIWQVIENGGNIMIHGDYDTDGVTGTALITTVLRKNGANVFPFIPHRFEDGYGFTPDSLEKALVGMNGECELLITVDCGITSNEAVVAANKRGIEVIITDHHEPSSELPEAMAILNPKVYDDLKDLQLLAGAGVAFKLCHAFIKYGRANNIGGFSTDLKTFLDLASLGTVADIVPLTGENRVIVKHGVEVLKKQLRPGIRSLFEVAGLKGKFNPSDITFRLAPRLNAAGRVGDATEALHLLLADSIVDAFQAARRLDEYNKIRQGKELEIFNEAQKQIHETIDLDNRRSILVAGHEWHQGVIGIVASRLAREYNRPAIVLTIMNGTAYGSGRSVSNFNLVETLRSCSDLLERFGGHPMAVGVGLLSKNIEKFAKAFEVETKKHFSAEDMELTVDYDGELELEDIDDGFFSFLERLMPFGHGNTKPVFRFNDLEVVKCYAVGKGHCRGMLKSKSNHSINFIAFNRSVNEVTTGIFDVLATPELNDYFNEPKPQLHIHDLRLVY